jgi:F-type H+-transporting ATPase subunit b
MRRERSTFLLLILVLAVAACASTVAWADGGEPESKPDLLSPRFDLGIWTIVVFVVLLLVLRKFAWGPMLEGLNKREQSILDEIAKARQEREEAEVLRKKFEQQMAESEERARAIIEQGRRDATELSNDMIAKAKNEMQAEKDRLYRELQLAKDQALQQLWNQAADLATLISSKALRRQMTIEDQRRLTDESLAELTKAAGRRETIGSAS